MNNIVINNYEFMIIVEKRVQIAAGPCSLQYESERQELQVSYTVYPLQSYIQQPA